ncbi:MAG TPA: hypothetical protein PK246_06145, partial [Saprospiraceae bacterium]|nr:hypothetical protein [Saprospiraceae bacterium]
MSLKGLFKLRNEIPPIQRNILMIGGILFILAVWVLLTTPLKDNPLLNDPTLLPPEGMTIEAYKATLVKKIPL